MAGFRLVRHPLRGGEGPGHGRVWRALGVRLRTVAHIRFEWRPQRSGEGASAERKDAENIENLKGAKNMKNAETAKVVNHAEDAKDLNNVKGKRACHGRKGRRG